jgi:hypothetical protein
MITGGYNVIRGSLPGFPKHHQPVRILIGQRLQNNGVDYTKHSRVGADSQGNHTNCDREKCWIEPKLSQRVYHILKHKTSP